MFNYEHETLSSAYWNYENTCWGTTGCDEVIEKQDPVKDPYSKVEINDYLSEDRRTTVRDYALNINDTYTIHDSVMIEDPWSIDQTLKFSKENGYLFEITSEVQFDGEHWKQTISANGQKDVLVDYKVPEDDFFSMADMMFALQPNESSDVTQSVNFESSVWTYEVASSDSMWSNDGDKWGWKQEVDLEKGSWTQELWVADVLIWADTWNTANSAWNFNLELEHD